MGYNRENYARIRESYKTKYLKAYAEADRRLEEIHAKSPEIAEIDRQLARTGAEIAIAALGSGEGYQQKLASVEEQNRALQEQRAAELEKMGYPADYTLPPYECPVCMDTGFVDTKMCECMRRELILAAYESSGLGKLLQTQSFENFDLRYYATQGESRRSMAENFKKLKDYAEGFSPESGNLILCGSTGLGKTHLSTAVARCVIDKGYDVFYTGSIEMFADFEQARFGFGEEKQQANEGLSRYTDCDLLILDDLGTEQSNQFTSACLYMVLNNRINLRRPTIINTNLNGKEIQSKYADRITSRLFGEFSVIPFTGTDIRRQKLIKK
ncbi:MAG: hypothetical protein E7590_02885 [Ruminococcaceae bacterium]|nr:hypothetical protein [Oscillospiraceae bacterium]